MTKSEGVPRLLLRSPRRSIGTRLFLIFVCATTLLVAVIGFLSYRIADQSLIRQMQASSEQTIALAGEKLDMQQQFYLDLSNQLMNNSRFMDDLFQIAIAELSDAERARRIESIRGAFDQLKLSDGRIRDITLIPLDLPLPPVSTIREGLAVETDADWIGHIRSAGGEAVWLPVRETGYFGSSPMPLFGYGRLFGKQNMGTEDFALVLQFESDVLEDMIQDVRLSAGGITAIAAADGAWMISNGEQPTEAPSALLAGLAGQEQGSFQRSDQGEEQLYAYRSSPISGWTLVGSAPLKELTQANEQIQHLATAGIAGSVVVALLIGLWLVRLIGIPLQSMEKLMKQAANGDFRGRMRMRGKDEVGSVAAAYNQMMTQLGEVVAETRRTVGELTASSDSFTTAATETTGSAQEIETASEQIAGGASELAANAERTNREVETLSASISRAFALQSESAEAAREVNEICGRGGEKVVELINKATQTEQQFSVAGERVDGLRAGAESIQEMLRLTTDMAKRIKILSLNAGIEAVRAGQRGSGFKVIADEIRQLADQSGRIIGQIGDAAESIQREVTLTVGSIGDTAPFFKEMIDDVHAVHRLFDTIQGQMERLHARSGEVTVALATVESVRQQLSVSIADVSSVSEQASASTQEVASLCSSQKKTSDRMAELSNQLKAISVQLEQQMKHFQIE